MIGLSHWWFGLDYQEPRLEHNCECLQECSLVYIVRTTWQEMNDIQPLTGSVISAYTIVNINKGCIYIHFFVWKRDMCMFMVSV